MRTARMIVAAVIAIASLYLCVGMAFADSAPTLRPDDHVLGKKNAPITIFEYASLTCPHCAEFANDTLPKIKANWIDTGKAKLVYRDFPLDQSALLAATVARCFPPDRYFAFIETLFASQREWVERDPTTTRAALARIARLGGMGQEQFDACANNKKNSDAVLNSRLVAQKSYGVNATPTFFIDGTKVVGALQYNEFVKHLTGKTSEAAPAVPGAATASNAIRFTIFDRIKTWFGKLVSRT